MGSGTVVLSINDIRFDQDRPSQIMIDTSLIRNLSYEGGRFVGIFSHLKRFSQISCAKSKCTTTTLHSSDSTTQKPITTILHKQYAIVC